MQTVCFSKKHNPDGRLRNAERYTCSVDDGILVGVALIGTLTEKDEETWEAKRAEVALCLPATADTAVSAFRQAAEEIGGYEIDEGYVRSLFSDDGDASVGDKDAALRRFGVEV